MGLRIKKKIIKYSNIFGDYNELLIKIIQVCRRVLDELKIGEIIDDLERNSLGHGLPR